MHLFDRKGIIRLALGFIVLASVRTANAQDNNSFLGLGIGHNNNMQQLSTVGVNVVGELPIGKSSSLYANFHWALGWVQSDGLHLASNVAATATFVLLSKDENSYYFAGEAAGILMLIPTGVTYYTIENDTSRTGIYLNPLNSEYFSFGENQEVLTYAPELGLKYMKHLHKKIYFYLSAGCAYIMALKEGSSVIKPDVYDDSPVLKLTVGLAFFGSKDRRKGMR